MSTTGYLSLLCDTVQKWATSDSQDGTGLGMKLDDHTYGLDDHTHACDTCVHSLLFVLIRMPV